MATNERAPEALRRQHDVVTGDVGEVLNEVDANPIATENLRERGQATESAIRVAGDLLARQATKAAPLLAAAESAVRELADYLRTLDQPLDENSLEKLAQQAEDASACLSGCAQCATGSGKGQGKGTGESEEEGKKGDGGEKGATKESLAEQASKVGELAARAKLMDDVLKKWGSSEAETVTPVMNAMRALRAGQNTDRLGADLQALQEQLAKAGEPDKALAAKAAALAQREAKLAAGLRQQRDAMRETRRTQITKLRQNVQRMIGDVTKAVAPRPGAAVEPDAATRGELSRMLPTSVGTQIIEGMRTLDDRDLKITADLLDTYRQRPVLAWRTLRTADARLATLLTDLQRVPPVAVRESRVPEGYQRLLRNYFQALSDDFDDQESATPAAVKK